MVEIVRLMTPELAARLMEYPPKVIDARCRWLAEQYPQKVATYGVDGAEAWLAIETTYRLG